MVHGVTQDQDQNHAQPAQEPAAPVIADDTLAHNAIIGDQEKEIHELEQASAHLPPEQRGEIDQQIRAARSAHQGGKPAEAGVMNAISEAKRHLQGQELQQTIGGGAMALAGLGGALSSLDNSWLGWLDDGSRRENGVPVPEANLSYLAYSAAIPAVERQREESRSLPPLPGN